MNILHDLPSSFYAFMFPTGICVLAIFIGLTAFGLNHETQTESLNFQPQTIIFKCGFDHYNSETGLFTFEKDGKLYNAETCKEVAQQSYPSVESDKK